MLYAGAAPSGRPELIMHEQTGLEPNKPMGTDPVCGMKVPLTTPHRFAMNGAEVLFCSARCRDRFAGDPSRYLTNGAAPAATYTCPMHPEVRAVRPGSCPK